MFNLVVLFYLADVCDGIHFASNTVFVLLAVLFGVFLLALMVASDYYEYKQLKEEIKNFNENFFDEFNNFIEFSDEDITKMLNNKEPKKNL